MHDLDFMKTTQIENVLLSLLSYKLKNIEPVESVSARFQIWAMWAWAYTFTG